MEPKLGQENAYPITEEQMDRIEQYPNYEKMAGMSKRFYAACAAMQGMLSNQKYAGFGECWIAQKSFSQADELLKLENE